MLVAGLVAPGEGRAASSALPVCSAPLAARAGVLTPGDELVYGVEILGLGVGAVRLGARRAALGATELVAHMEPRRFLSALMRVEGDAASVWPQDGVEPAHTRVAYRFRSQRYTETQTLYPGGRVVAERSKDGKHKSYERDLTGPALDFLAAVSLAGALPVDAESCALLAHDGKVYTAWARPRGTQKVEALGGKVRADRYDVVYAHERGKKAERLTVWVSVASPRVVVRAESDAALSPVFVLSDRRL